MEETGLFGGGNLFQITQTDLSKNLMSEIEHELVPSSMEQTIELRFDVSV